MAGLTHLTAQAKPGPSIDGKASVVRPETPEHNSSRLISRGVAIVAGATAPDDA
eukprot:COSAG01_NODE_648_length_14530_cov_206.392281_10_plen_54_part_00